MPTISPDAGALGVLCIVVGWLMFAVTQRLDRLTAAVEVVSRAMLIDLVSRDNLPGAIQQEIRDALRKMNVVLPSDRELKNAAKS